MACSGYFSTFSVFGYPLFIPNTTKVNYFKVGLNVFRRLRRYWRQIM